eukprot:735651-Rhodomonas_salina.2
MLGTRPRISLRECYAVSGTDVVCPVLSERRYICLGYYASGGICAQCSVPLYTQVASEIKCDLRTLRCAMPGTGLAYGARRAATVCVCGARTELERMSWRMVLWSAYAVPGTELAYGATTRE